MGISIFPNGSKMWRYIALLSVLIGLLVPISATAHHSQAEFDSSQILEMSGEVVAAYWRNPHVNFTLKTIDDAGQEQLWEMESSAWNAVSRRGVTKDLISAGDIITVAVNRSTKRPNHARLLGVLLDSGVEVLFAGNTPRWSDNVVGGNGSRVEPVSELSTSDAGLYQIWTIAGGRRVPLDRELPLTDAAREAQAAWDPLTEDPLLKCVAPGMPPTMGNPYPMQFSQQGEDIILHLEEFDNVRTIYMMAADPGELSHLGYSVGRWQGGSLLVETANINYPYFNRVGVAQSGRVTTSEIFTLSENGERLDYQLSITDPETLSEPVTWSTHFLSGQGEEIKPYECTVERYVPQ